MPRHEFENFPRMGSKGLQVKCPRPVEHFKSKYHWDFPKIVWTLATSPIGGSEVSAAPVTDCVKTQRI